MKPLLLTLEAAPDSVLWRMRAEPAARFIAQLINTGSGHLLLELRDEAGVMESITLPPRGGWVIDITKEHAELVNVTGTGRISLGGSIGESARLVFRPDAAGAEFSDWGFLESSSSSQSSTSQSSNSSSSSSSSP